MQNRFGGGLIDAIENPLVLGGLSLLAGGGFDGLNGGIRSGVGLQDRRRQVAEEDQRKQQFEGLLGSGFDAVPPQIAQIARAAGPEKGLAILAQYADPMNGLDAQYKKAQINRLNREATEAGQSYGKSGSIFLNPETNRYEAVQFGGDGSIKRTELGGLTPSRGVSEVDTGTGTQIIDKATGQVVRQVGKDLAGAEQQKIVGRETGERVMGMPKAEASLASAAAKTELVRGKIQQARSLVSNYSVGYGSLLKNVPGTQALNLKEAVNTIIANMGFEELQDMRQNSPTGGALGAIAVQELEMLQKTRTSLEQAQTMDQFNKALNELDTFMQGADQRRKQAFDATYGGVQQPVQNPSGVPKVGALMDGYRFKGGNPADPNSWERQ